MRIQELADETGVTPDTIRYYEKRGLLPEPPRRSQSGFHPGYRQFCRVDIARVHFVRRAQALGFSLDQIRQLLELRYDPDAQCEPIIALAQAKLGEIDDKLAELQKIRASLTDFMADCNNSEPASECSFFDAVIATAAQDDVTT